MPNIGFYGTDPAKPSLFGIKGPFQGFNFNGIAYRGAGAVGFDITDILRFNFGQAHGGFY